MTSLKVKLNRTGDMMPLLGLGTYKSEAELLTNAIETAIQHGCRLIDCASMYKNESAVGVALHHAFQSGIVKRNEIFVVSKVWNDNHAPEKVIESCKKTLKDLQLDYLDLYLVHWPVCYEPGQTPNDAVNVPLTDTWSAMERLVDEGLVRNIGTSNFTGRQLDEIIASARIKPAVNQVEFHPLLQQTKQREYCASHDIVMMGYRPLVNNSSPRRGKDTPNVLCLPEIIKIAQRIGDSVTPAQVIIAWALRCGVSVVPKSTNHDRIVENMGGINIVDKLTDDDMKTIASLDKHIRTCGPVYYAGRTAEEFWDGE